MKYMWVLVAAITLTFAPAIANTPFDHLQIDNERCNLVQSGSRNQSVVWEGRSEIGMCHVVVPVEEFSRTYSHCALSGVLGDSGPVMCEFGYSDRERTKVFFLAKPKNVCQFVCVKHPPKG
ncbi:hypothetical protein AAV94_10320 [Lampropedia cohaerens]|uniref:Uncharacterized protein n=1 Tax=Lampropedia cohaerens TaxID=1610491 RepID=A0A0U1PYE4_9BURK|nr:hypothetical protein [Lampropedia cohaerens]KKW67542.1 hypothetical protein AAV94_10320 [Lampropedia cohaerens]